MKRKNKKKLGTINTFINECFKSDHNKTKFNNIVAFIVIALGIMGLFFLLSASSYLTIKFGLNRYYYFTRQAVFFIVGVILMFIISKLDFKFYYRYSFLFYVISIIFLILCYVPGISVPINGAKRMIRLGITFMPSDVAKITCIIFFAWFLDKTKNVKQDIKQFLVTGSIIVVPFALIFMQTDLSTSVVLLLSLGIMYFVGGFNAKHLPILIVLVVIAGFLATKVLKPYQLDRITGFVNPEAYYKTFGWQVLNGLFAVTRGGVDGVGFGKSIFKQGYLGNEVNSDMIFAVIAEEFGFLGAVSILLIVFLLAYLVIKESLRCRDKFTKLVVFGIGMMYLIQSLINIGVSLSIIPNTGINLPFISNGGTSMISFYIMFGIFLNISRKNNYDKKMKIKAMK